jgi:dTDP-glucose pyrophosphorylase
MERINILIPMAGLGTRFKDTHPGQYKPFIDVSGTPMLELVVENNNQLENTNFIFVVRDDMPYHKIDEILKDKNISYTIIKISEKTEGSACTCLLASELIDNDTPLIITNCDQVTLDLDIWGLVQNARINNSDGILGVFNSNSNKNSYVKLGGDLTICEVKEKIVISNIATNGLHYWKHGKYFVESANKMIANNERYNNEFYVAPTYNYLISEGKKITPYYFNLHFPIGTPEDLKYFENTVYGNF